MVSFFLRNAFQHRLKRIDFFQWQELSYRLELVLILLIVKITILGRCKYYIVSLSNGLHTTFCSAPRHNGCIRCQTTLQYLIPTDDALAMLMGKILDTLDHIALQFLDLYQALSLHPGLTIRTDFPVILTCLISTDMDIFAWEHLKDFQKDIFQELISALFSRTQFPLISSAILQTASQLRISGTGLIIMSRQLYFRNDLNMSFGCERQNLSDILLCIVTAISSRCSFIDKISSCFIYFPIPEIFHRAPCCVLSQTWICINLQAPARIVNQMEMETVKLEKSHHFQLLKNKGFTLIMAAFVQHDSTMLETRPVKNSAATDCIVQSRYHLNGLTGIEHSLRICRHNRNLLLSYFQPVSGFKLPISQFVPFQEAKKSLLRNLHLFRQISQFI